LFEQLGERHFVVIDPVFGVRSERAVNAKAIRIAARQQRRARRRTHWLGDVKIRELAAFPRQAIKVRSLESFRAEHADIAVALIVGENDANVRQALRSGDSRGRSNRKCEC